MISKRRSLHRGGDDGTRHRFATRARASFVGVALLAAGLIVGGTSTPAGAAQGGFTSPGIRSFVVPSWVDTIFIDAVGGQGGHGAPLLTAALEPGGVGGFGARVQAAVSVVPGTTLCGGVGLDGGPGSGSGPVGTQNAGGKGGSQSDVRLPRSPNTVCGSKISGDSTDSRDIVAGGGGGGGGAGTLFPGFNGGEASFNTFLASSCGVIAPATLPSAADGQDGDGPGAPPSPPLTTQGNGSGGGGGTCFSGGAGGPGGSFLVSNPSLNGNPGTAGGPLTGGRGGTANTLALLGGGGGGAGGGWFGGGGGGGGAINLMPLIMGAGGGGGAGSSFVGPFVVTTTAAGLTGFAISRPADCVTPLGGVPPNPPVCSAVAAADKPDVQSMNPQVLIAYRPSPPQNVTASAGPIGGAVNLTWLRPADTGGTIFGPDNRAIFTPITSYTITATDTTTGAMPTKTVLCGALGLDCGASISTVMTGLTPGHTFTFTIVATNVMGDSDPSATSLAFTLPGQPSAPQNVVATTVAGTTSATVTWSPPASNGGSPIVAYQVTAHRTTFTCGDTSEGTKTIVGNPPATTVTFTGLVGGAWAFCVQAKNALGLFSSDGTATGGWGVSDAILVGLPAAPTNVVATPGPADGQATLSWTPSIPGASPVLHYTVTSNSSTPGAALPSKIVTCPAACGSPVTTTMTGLTAGAVYTFTVTPTNSVGDGPSATSNAIKAPPFYNQGFNATTDWTVTISQHSNNFSPPVQWHRTAACAAGTGGTAAMYYGRDAVCNTDDTVDTIGEMRSPLITGLPASYVLRFGARRQVRTSSTNALDQTIMEANFQDGTGWHQIYYADATISGGAGPNDNAFHGLVIPLSSSSGSVQLRARFVSVFASSSGLFGWSIDNVRLNAT